MAGRTDSERFNKTNGYCRFRATPTLITSNDREESPCQKPASKRYPCDILTKIGKTEEADNLRKRTAAISNVEPASKP